MAKIKNPKSFSEVFKLDSTILLSKGIFDPVLNVDTKLFIDPVLLQKSSSKYFREDVLRVYEEHYNNMISLLEESKEVNDIAWRSAKNLIQRKEVDGTCLGYGVNSTSGRSITSKLQEMLVKTAKEIVDIGIKKPELFILLPLFESGVGPDTISDITTAAIQESLYKFTASLAAELGVKTTRINFRGEEIEVIKNPLKKKFSPIILLPKDVLRELPFASTWDEIHDVSFFNHELRMRVNKYIGDIWKAKTKKEKARELAKIKNSKNAIEVLIELINSTDVKPYDFVMDKNGVFKWREILASVAKEYPISLKYSEKNTSGLVEVVKQIIEQFKFLIEDRGLCKLLWKEKNKPNHESVSQMLFFSTAYSYCKANNIDISPEMDTGSGCVDFKFSSGFNKRVIVEIKHSYNSNIISGFEIQLNLYKKAEETCFGFYIVVDVGHLGKKYDKLIKMYNESEKKADLIYIDGEVKESASKRR